VFHAVGYAEKLDALGKASIEWVFNSLGKRRHLLHAIGEHVYFVFLPRGANRNSVLLHTAERNQLFHLRSTTP
jgi:hypothetical protein